MKTIPKQTLSSAIAAVVAVSSDITETSKVAHITATDDSLTIKATNLSEWLSVTVTAPGPLADAQVDAKTLQSVIAAMRGDVVKLDVADGALHLTGKGRRKIAVVFSEYPALPVVEGVTVEVPAAALRNAVDFVAANISDDASLMSGALMGVHFHTVDGTLRAVSVAGNSCVCIDVQPCADELEATLSKSALGLLKHIPENADVSVTFGPTLISIRWDGGEIVAKRVAGTFANYQRLVPTHDHKLHISADELRKGLSSIQPVSVSDKQIGSSRTLLDLSPQVDAETGRVLDGMDAGLIGQAQGVAGTEPLDAEWTGPNAKIAFAARVMSNVLSGFTGELEVGITPFAAGEQPKPMLIHQKGLSDRFAFMMPLKSAI